MINPKKLEYVQNDDGTYNVRIEYQESGACFPRVNITWSNDMCFPNVINADVLADNNEDKTLCQFALEE